MLLSSRKKRIHIERAILNIVGFMLLGSVFADRQNFRFRPSSIFEPIGSEFSLHRL